MFLHKALRGELLIEILQARAGFLLKIADRIDARLDQLALAESRDQVQILNLFANQVQSGNQTRSATNCVELTMSISGKTGEPGQEDGHPAGFHQLQGLRSGFQASPSSFLHLVSACRPVFSPCISQAWQHHLETSNAMPGAGVINYSSRHPVSFKIHHSDNLVKLPQKPPSALLGGSGWPYFTLEPPALPSHIQGLQYDENQSVFSPIKV